MNKILVASIIFFCYVGIAHAEDIQSQRKAFLQHLIHKGLFTKIEQTVSRAAEAWVTDRFYALSFDGKQAYVSVIYAYYFEAAYKKGDKMNIVLLYDSRSGKKVGKYSVNVGGLQMD